MATLNITKEPGRKKTNFALRVHSDFASKKEKACGQETACMGMKNGSIDILHYNNGNNIQRFT